MKHVLQLMCIIQYEKFHLSDAEELVPNHKRSTRSISRSSSSSSEAFSRESLESAKLRTSFPRFRWHRIDESKLRPADVDQQAQPDKTHPTPKQKDLPLPPASETLDSVPMVTSRSLGDETRKSDNLEN